MTDFRNFRKAKKDRILHRCSNGSFPIFKLEIIHLFSESKLGGLPGFGVFENTWKTQWLKITQGDWKRTQNIPNISNQNMSASSDLHESHSPFHSPRHCRAKCWESLTLEPGIVEYTSRFPLKYGYPDGIRVSGYPLVVPRAISNVMDNFGVPAIWDQLHISSTFWRSNGFSVKLTSFQDDSVR